MSCSKDDAISLPEDETGLSGNEAAPRRCRRGSDEGGMVDTFYLSIATKGVLERIAEKQFVQNDSKETDSNRFLPNQDQALLVNGSDRTSQSRYRSKAKRMVDNEEADQLSGLVKQ